MSPAITTANTALSVATVVACHAPRTSERCFVGGTPRRDCRLDSRGAVRGVRSSRAHAFSTLARPLAVITPWPAGGPCQSQNRAPTPPVQTRQLVHLSGACLACLEMDCLSSVRLANLQQRSAIAQTSLRDVIFKYLQPPAACPHVGSLSSRFRIALPI